MDFIKQNAQDIKKVGIQMTGLLTLMSIGGVTQENLKMLHDINQELVTKVNLIVDSSTKMNSDLTEANDKVDFLRKELASSKKRLFEAKLERYKATSECKKMKVELDSSRESLTSLFDTSMDDDFQLIPSGKGCTSTPCKSSAPAPSVVAVVLGKDMTDCSAGKECTNTPCKSSAPAALDGKGVTDCGASASATSKSNISNKGDEEKSDDSRTEKYTL